MFNLSSKRSGSLSGPLQLVVMALAVILSISQAIDGQAYEFERQEANVDEHPFLAKIEPHCSGIIISETEIITSSKCAAFAGTPPKDVRVGVHNPEDDSDGYIVAIDKIHSYGNSINNLPDYGVPCEQSDLSIITLAEELTFGPRVQPLRLSDYGVHLPSTEMLVAYGWGRNKEGNLSTVKSVFSLVRQDKCFPSNSLDHFDPSSHFCARPINGSVKDWLSNWAIPLVSVNFEHKTAELVGIMVSPSSNNKSLVFSDMSRGEIRKRH